MERKLLTRRRIVASLLLTLNWGCGSSGLGKPVAHFPARAELETIAEKPAAPVAPFPVRSVEHWQLQLTAPAPGAAYPTESPWDEQLRTAATAQAGLEPSAELRCAALETARFYTENAAFPDSALRPYLLAYCGSSLPSASLRTLTFEVDDQQPEAELARAATERLKQLLVGLGPGAVGLGFARGQGRGSVVVYHGAARAVVEQLPPLATEEQFVVGGHLLGEAASAMALVTLGRYGVGLCEPDRRLESPRFSFTCPMAPKDEQAIVEIITRKPERLLGQAVLRTMVRRSPAAGKSYDANFAELSTKAAAKSDSATTAATPSFQDSLLTALNRIRRAAHLDPLAIEPSQSQFNTRLAPHFFEASFADDEARVDVIALGVLAGWDVGGLIRAGGVYAGDQETLDGARWLGMALRDPVGRYTFLNPDITKLAIGTHEHQQSGVMALVSTYSLFDSADHSLEEAAVFEELAKQRAARGLPAPLRRARGEYMSKALQQVAKGERTSGEALQDVVNDVSEITHRRVKGFVIETSDVSLAPIDDALLAPGNLELELGVAHYKPQGGAWGQYVILYLFATGTPSPAESAALPSSPHG